ncbi:Acetyl esterase Axe7A precursor [Rubripirellula lacrimiformis]|uniref:Acetyl esterase Axe7A n=1 Tax=Rubripirellula lacrimiformis TaxID=1930273 RepID=A0A517NH74_9BACT|nr:acetylxylan esterase [Rubripirellula lacrimiformis]QDT06485.1 Acetyl esterase Axe7A precursor [Rubripirellula lacrimiformis]
MNSLVLNAARLITIATLVHATSMTGALHAADEYSVTVTADHQDAIYEAGQQAAFLITVKHGDQPVSDGTVKYTIDDFTRGNQSAVFAEGELTLGKDPSRAVIRGDKAGFLRCQVTYQPDQGKAVNAIAGAAFSPAQIAPSLPVPDDFDEFWSDQKRQLAEIPINPKLTPVDSGDAAIESYDVQVPCWGGAPVSGYFAKPKSAAAKSLPAILWVHGAGVRSSILSNAVRGAQSGMLSMDINAHGLANGKPDDFYAQASSGPLKNYRSIGRQDRNTIYFRGMFLRLVRAIDFLAAQPEWNGREIVVIGHSQGGGQAIAAGGLDPRVTMIAAGVPAICDHSGVIAGRVNGWPKLVPMTDDGVPDPSGLEASRYVDAVNFASRCQAQAIMSVGFIDSVCPPSSCYAAYNALQGPKRILHEPLMGHAAPPHIQDAFFQSVLDHVKLSSVETP